MQDRTYKELDIMNSMTVLFDWKVTPFINFGSFVFLIQINEMSFHFATFGKIFNTLCFIDFLRPNYNRKESG